MKEIILATKNKHKTKEFRQIFNDMFIIRDLNNINYTEEIIESGNSFIENAIIKAKTIFNHTGKPVISDDSGLAVEALGFEPGIHSARYGGENLSDADRYNLLLKNMKNTLNRKAHFVCALILYISHTRIYVVQEQVSGSILQSPVGTNGFGYDPVFFVDSLNKGMAELSDEEKNSISHRGKASLNLKKIIEELNLLDF